MKSKHGFIHNWGSKEECPRLLNHFKGQLWVFKKNCITIIYLWIKVVCFVLFWSLVMKSTKLRCFRLCSWCLWKAFNKEGCMGLVPWHLDLWCKSSWILNDFFIENYWVLSPKETPQSIFLPDMHKEFLLVLCKMLAHPIWLPLTTSKTIITWTLSTSK